MAVAPVDGEPLFRLRLVVQLVERVALATHADARPQLHRRAGKLQGEAVQRAATESRHCLPSSALFLSQHCAHSLAMSRATLFEIFQDTQSLHTAQS